RRLVVHARRQRQRAAAPRESPGGDYRPSRLELQHGRRITCDRDHHGRRHHGWRGGDRRRERLADAPRRIGEDDFGDLLDPVTRIRRDEVRSLKPAHRLQASGFTIGTRAPLTRTLPSSFIPPRNTTTGRRSARAVIAELVTTIR